MSSYVKRRGTKAWGISRKRNLRKAKKMKEAGILGYVSIGFQPIPLPKPLAKNISANFWSLRAAIHQIERRIEKTGLSKFISNFELIEFTPGNQTLPLPSNKIQRRRKQKTDCKSLFELFSRWASRHHQTIDLLEDYMERSSSSKNSGASKLINNFEAISKPLNFWEVLKTERCHQ